MKNKFLKISCFILVFVSVFTISFSVFASTPTPPPKSPSWTPPPPPEGSYIGGNVENSNSVNSTNNSISNSDGTLHWDIWSSFRNECLFTYYAFDDPDFSYTKVAEDNTVSRLDYGIVTIANKDTSPFVPISAYWDSIRTVALSTPLNALKNNFYVYENYVGSEMVFKINITLNVVEGSAYGGKFRLQPETAIKPRFRIYEGSSNLDYKVNYCTTTRKYIRAMNDEIISYDFYVHCTFDEPTFVCGFWCGLTFDEPLMFVDNASTTDNNKMPRFVATYSLSPMYFLGSSSFDDFYESENELFDKLYKFVLPGVWFNDNVPDYDETLKLGQVKQAMFFISNLLNFWVNNFIIFKVLFNISLSVTLVMVVLGISSSIIGIIRNSNPKSNRKGG
jgi:hypothetical protein